MKISRRSVFRSVSALAASNVLLQLLGFLYRIFLSRMTGAEGIGVYQLIMPFYSVVTAITLTGITVAVARVTAERAALGDFHGARRCVVISRRLFIALAAVTTAATLLFADTISRSLLGDIRCLKALPFILVCLLFTGFENIFKNYFYGVSRVKPQIVSELSEQTVRIAAVAALLLIFRPENAGDAAVLIVCGMVVSELVSSSLLALFYLPEKRRLCRVRTKNTPLLPKLLAIALPVSAAAALNTILSSANAVLIPRRLVAFGMTQSAALESFGVLFGMTMPLLMLPIAFIAAITAIMIPKVSEELARGNEADVRRKAGKTIHTTGLLAMPCMAILVPLGAPACRCIFNCPTAGEFMLPLCIATLLSYYQLTTGALMNGIGMQKRAAVYIVLGGLLQLVFTWSVGLPHIGMKGFVYGFLLSSLLTAALNFVSLVRRLKIKPRFRNWFFNPAISATLGALLAELFFHLLLGNGIREPAALVLSAVGGFLVYFAAINALGTSPTEYIRTLVPENM